MTNNRQMLLGSGFVRLLSVISKARKSDSVNITTYPVIKAEILYAQMAEQGNFQFIFIGNFP